MALAIVQTTKKDCGVYKCEINNEYGTDATDCLLSEEGNTNGILCAVYEMLLLSILKSTRHFFLAKLNA